MHVCLHIISSHREPKTTMGMENLHNNQIKSEWSGLGRFVIDFHYVYEQNKKLPCRQPKKKIKAWPLAISNLEDLEEYLTMVLVAFFDLLPIKNSIDR